MQATLFSSVHFNLPRYFNSIQRMLIKIHINSNTINIIKCYNKKDYNYIQYKNIIWACA